jgi:uncharacterized membrane protein YbaN (DUF454 family)
MTAKFRKVGGFALIGAGIIGLVLPLIPGIPLLLAGAAVLGSDHPLVRNSKRWLHDRGILKKKEESI